MPSSRAPSTVSNRASSPAAWPSVRLRPRLGGPAAVAVHDRGDVARDAARGRCRRGCSGADVAQPGVPMPDRERLARSTMRRATLLPGDRGAANRGRECRMGVLRPIAGWPPRSWPPTLAVHQPGHRASAAGSSPPRSRSRSSSRCSRCCSWRSPCIGLRGRRQRRPRRRPDRLPRRPPATSPTCSPSRRRRARAGPGRRHHRRLARPACGSASAIAGSIEHVCNRAWQVPGRGLLGKLFGLGWLLGAIVLARRLDRGRRPHRRAPRCGWRPCRSSLGMAMLVGFFLFTFRLLTTTAVPLATTCRARSGGAVGVSTCSPCSAPLSCPGWSPARSALYGSIGVVFALLA